MKIPLYVKLMVSYLLVVGLVLLPSVVYVRLLLTRDQHARARADMEAELAGLCDRLGDATPSQLAARTEMLLAALPTRLTVIDATGRVLGDSLRPSGAMENHGDRPEVRAALRDGAGSDLRRSRTTGQMTLYVAMRFPRAGAVRGVARLSRPEAVVNTARDQVTDVLGKASAVALSVAVLLSLVAALAASRPLRRIAQGARAFADGDFGAPIEADTGDEIGEVAEALAALASQLRSKLVTSGADRATLQALLDDLPVGVVLYDERRRPVAVNGAARALCDLAPYAEAERGAEIPKLDGQRAAVERALREGFTVEAPLRLPWRAEAELVARWVVVFANDGARLPALVVIDRAPQRTVSRLRETLRALRAVLASVPASSLGPERAAEVTRACLAADEVLPPPDVEADAVEPVPVRALFEQASADLDSLATLAGARFELLAGDVDVAVAEADGRGRRALRALMGWALDDPRRGPVVTVSAAVQDRHVRLSVLASRAVVDAVPDVGALVRPIAGDAGVAASDEGVDCWLLLPRA